MIVKIMLLLIFVFIPFAVHSSDKMCPQKPAVASPKEVQALIKKMSPRELGFIKKMGKTPEEVVTAKFDCNIKRGPATKYSKCGCGSVWPSEKGCDAACGECSDCK